MKRHSYTNFTGDIHKVKQRKYYEDLILIRSALLLTLIECHKIIVYEEFSS